jgi:hypothetical protein
MSCAAFSDLNVQAAKHTEVGLFLISELPYSFGLLLAYACNLVCIN